MKGDKRVIMKKLDRAGYAMASRSALILYQFPRCVEGGAQCSASFPPLSTRVSLGDKLARWSPDVTAGK
jgi:hypothetical protein